MLLTLLMACPTEVDSSARLAPLLPDEPTFQAMRAELQCAWLARCVEDPSGTALWDCAEKYSSTETLDLLALRACGATYNPGRAGECLAIWRENPVDCSVSFYSGCEAGDWYDGADECPAWYEQ